MSSLINGIGLNNTLTKNQTSPIGGNSYWLNAPIKDEVCISDKKDEKDKKGLSTKAKAAIATAFGMAATAAFLIYKAKISEVKKLAEHIDFKPAETLEEAIEFARKTLGIKQVAGFTEADLEVLNYANEGLVHVSNAHKGQLRMPKVLQYDEAKDGCNAFVVRKAYPPYEAYEGLFVINKNFYSKIDEKLSDVWRQNLGKLNEKTNLYEYDPDKCPKEIWDRAVDLTKLFNEGNATLKQKVWLNELRSLGNDIIFKEVTKDIKKCLKNKENMKILKDAGINLENVFKPVPDDLFIGTVNEIRNALEKAGKEIKFGLRGYYNFNINPFNTIYHEMGHLQDMKPRALAVEKFDFDESKYPKELSEWVNNKEYMDTAREVSSYSMSGSGEFIAEAYAEMIAGNKLSDRVMDLYKKLGGPSIPGIV